MHENREGFIRQMGDAEEEASTLKTEEGRAARLAMAEARRGKAFRTGSLARARRVYVYDPMFSC